MSRTSTLLPILGCLAKSEEYLKGDIKWEGHSEQQKDLIERFKLSKQKDDLLNMKDMECRAADDSKVINDFLKENGYDINISPMYHPKDFAVAAILNVLVEWLEQGKEIWINSNGTNFPGVSIENFEICYMDAKNHDEFQFIRLSTKSDDVVYMSLANPLAYQMEISDWAANVKFTGMSFGHMQYKSCKVHFPMIDYNEEIDLKWIQGITFKDKRNDEYKIKEAVQQTKFRMNEVGARVESAAAMKMVFRCALPMEYPIVIDQPFVLWIERPGLSTPIFSALFTQEHWKKPANLETISKVGELK